MFDIFRKKKPVCVTTCEAKLAMVEAYLDNAIAGFVNDPADSRYQEGYEASLVELRDWMKEL